MSDIKDRLKFNSGTDKVTKSVADAVSEVLNSGQPAKSRFAQQAELMGYPLQDKPEVAESFNKELQELRKAVNDDKRSFIAAARQAKKNGDKTFMFAGKEYPCTVGEMADMGDEEGKKKLKETVGVWFCKCGWANAFKTTRMNSDVRLGLNCSNPKNSSLTIIRLVINCDMI